MADSDPAVIRSQLEQWLAAGLAAVDPVAATRRALDASPPPTVAPAIIATGKAAAGMALAAVEWLAGHGLEPVGGLVVSHESSASPHPSIMVAQGDHPVPGADSNNAAMRLADTIEALSNTTPVHVLLSGGTSALIAAPLPGITAAELHHAFELFHQLGLDIVAMNGLRSRLTRWSSGRLATALGDRPVHAWVISDVLDNDLATIGSGPLVARSIDLENIFRIIANPELLAKLPPSVRAVLTHGTTVGLREIPHTIVADGRMAAEALVAATNAAGIRGTLHRHPIVGEAEAAGVELARWIHAEIRQHRLPDASSGVLVEPVPRVGRVHVWRSETTVTLPVSHGTGGRAQQLALATASEIGDLGFPTAATVLVAGTDGRDGPTDAAGAVINAGTLAALREAGVDVDAALAHCDSYPALDAVGALLRTGSTGTNVADLVVVWLWNWY